MYKSLYALILKSTLFLGLFMSLLRSPSISQSGVLDVTFGKKGKVVSNLSDSYSRAFSVLVQPDQKILAAGDAVINNAFVFALTRYNIDGTPDASFGNGGKVFTSFNTVASSVRSMVIQTDGKIVAAGQLQVTSSTDIQFGLARYNTNGSIDSSFGMNGKVITKFGNGYNGLPGKIVIKPDGGFIVAGSKDSGFLSTEKQDIALVQYKPNGILDSAFGLNGIVITDILNRNEQCYSLAVQEDGKIVAGGSSAVPNTATLAFTAIRYYSNGIVDSSFGTEGHVFSNIDSSSCRGSSLLIQPDGKIIIAGDINDVGREDFGMVRFTSDGIPDSTFGENGKAITPMSKSNDPQNYINTAYLQPDGKILLAGIASPDYLGGDFVLLRYNTDGSLDNTFGRRGIIKTDFANGVDFCSALAVQQDGKIVLAGSAKADTANNTDRTDLALARYEKNALINYDALDGFVFLDNNANAVHDTNEPFFNNVTISTIKQGIDTIVTNTSNGKFSVIIDTGTYVTSVVPYLPYYQSVPASHVTSNTNYFTIDSAFFSIQPISGKRDVSISIIPLKVARPGFPVQYKIFYINQGTDTITDGTIKLLKNSKINFISASPATTSQNGDTLLWNYFNFKPLDTASITVNLSVQPPPYVNIGDTLISTANISSSGTDLTPNNNTSAIAQRVIGSYDPNDKTESHGGMISELQVASGEYLQYMIRFQNTGNDTAFNIYLRDTLSSKLDWSTFQMVSSSHNYQLTVNDGGICYWAFTNINLVDSNQDEKASHGYLVYRIKPKATLSSKDTIFNSAAVFFDYNLPISTNTEETVIAQQTLPLTLITFTAAKTDKVNLLHWLTAGELNVSYFEIQRSANGHDFESIGKVTSGLVNYTFTDNNPLKAINFYRLKMIDKDGHFAFSLIRAIDNSESLYASIYPNPVRDRLTLSLQSPNNQTIILQLISVDGKVILLNQTTINKGTNKKSINISSLLQGSYMLRIISFNKQQTMLKFKKL